MQVIWINLVYNNLEKQEGDFSGDFSSDYFSGNLGANCGWLGGDFLNDFFGNIRTIGSLTRQHKASNSLVFSDKAKPCWALTTQFGAKCEVNFDSI